MDKKTQLGSDPLGWITDTRREAKCENTQLIHSAQLSYILGILLFCGIVYPSGLINLPRTGQG
jgi:hypothetical protein